MKKGDKMDFGNDCFSRINILFPVRSVSQQPNAKHIYLCQDVYPEMKGWQNTAFCE